MGHFKSAESATIAHGIVKPSKSFSIFTGVALVVGIFFLALKRFAKTEDQSPLFVVLAAAFLLTAVFLFLYTKRFQITYDETGFTVRTLFRKNHRPIRSQTWKPLHAKKTVFCSAPNKEIFGWKKNFTLVQRIFLPSCRIMFPSEKLDGL